MHDQLPAYFDGELDAARGRAFEDHLNGVRETVLEAFFTCALGHSLANLLP